MKPPKSFLNCSLDAETMKTLPVSILKRQLLCLLALSLLLALIACKRGVSATPEQLKEAEGQPQQAIVQHVLIGFDSSSLNDKAKRGFNEAKALSKKIYRRATSGDDFDELVETFSDAEKPGIMTINNYGVSIGYGEIGRKDLVEGFTNASFGLSVNEITMTGFDMKDSPSGFHIIKRLK